MITAENLFSNLLTVSILLGLALIIYSKISGKTLPDMVHNVREMFANKAEDVAEYVPRGFDDIR